MEGPALLILSLFLVTCMNGALLLSSNCLLREYKNTTDVCTLIWLLYLFLIKSNSLQLPLCSTVVSLTGSPARAEGGPRGRQGSIPALPHCSASILLLKFPTSQTQPEKPEGLGTCRGSRQEQRRDGGRVSTLKGGWENDDSPASSQNALL